MKKIFAILLITSFISGCMNQSNHFEGKITYKMITDPTLASDITFGDDKFSHFTNEGKRIVYFKNNKTREEDRLEPMNPSENGAPTPITIWDHQQKLFYFLSDLGGVKYMRKNIDSGKGKEPEINYTSETKIIAGYECKKAHITFNSKAGEKSETGEVYYTEQLPYYSSYDEFKGLKGFPMELRLLSGDSVYEELIVTSVSKEPIQDSLFIVPKEYKEMSFDQAMKELQVKNEQIVKDHHINQAKTDSIHNLPTVFVNLPHDSIKKRLQKINEQEKPNSKKQEVK